MRAVGHLVDEALPVLAFLVYVVVEAVVIYTLLRWAGALG